MNPPNNPLYTPPKTIDLSKLGDILAKHRAAKNPPIAPITNVPPENLPSPAPDFTQGIGRTGEVITYNAEQQEFIRRMSNGEDAVLIGAAGSGKTTCQQGGVQGLILSGRAGILKSNGHKYLRDGAPGIVIIAYTRRATSNIRKSMPENMKDNCITYHKLMEYEPVFYTVTDPVTGKEINKMNFEPTRNYIRPLPSSIHTIVIEEGSMFSKEYYEELVSACPHKPQFIFLGDIQQLPPVFGSAILGYKMLELPCVELTQIYRQALESPIIRLAHRILSGNPIPPEEFPEWKIPGKLTLHPWKKKLSSDVALLTAAAFFTGAVANNLYDPEQDMILLPFNKAFGTDDLNRHIATYIAKRQERIVYEIVAGFEKLYLAVGDKVMFEKEDAIVTNIEPNLAYGGRAPQPSSKTLDYFGHDTVARAHNEEDDKAAMDNIDFILAQAANMDDEDRVRQASHVVTLRRVESDVEIQIETAGELNALILGYALTIHKAQGSEWRKVFLVLHQSHATMLQRELLYTAVTRAKEELYVICEPESFVNGIRSQRIKGNTLAEKAEFFKGKVAEKAKNDALIGMQNATRTN